MQGSRFPHLQMRYRTAHIKTLARSQTAIVAAETIVLSLLMLASFSMLSRMVEPKSLGLWFLLNSILAYTRIGDFWSNGLSSFVAESLGRGHKDTAVEFVGTAIVSGLVGHTILATLGCLGLWIAAPWLVEPENLVTMRQMLPIMAVGFWLTAVASNFHTAFLGFGRPGLKACQTIMGAVIFLVSTVILVPHGGLKAILVSQIIQGSAMLIFGLAASFVSIAVASKLLRWNRLRFLALASFGSKNFVLGLVQLSIDPIIRLLVNHFGGLAAVTAIELASRLIVAVRGLIVSFGQVLIPKLARIAAKDNTQTENLYSEVQMFYTAAAIPVFSLLIALSPFLEFLLLARNGSGFTALIAILSFGWMMNTLAAPAHFLAMSKRRMRPLIVAHMIMAFGAIGLGHVLGIVWGVEGALAGAALSIAAAAIYLQYMSSIEGQGLFQLSTVINRERSLLPTMAVALAVPILMNLTPLQNVALVYQLALSTLATTVVVLCSLKPLQVKALLRQAGRLA